MVVRYLVKPSGVGSDKVRRGDAPGSTATVVVVSRSRVRSREVGRVFQGGEVSLDTSSL